MASQGFSTQNTVDLRSILTQQERITFGVFFDQFVEERAENEATRTVLKNSPQVRNDAIACFLYEDLEDLGELIQVYQRLTSVNWQRGLNFSGDAVNKHEAAHQALTQTPYNVNAMGAYYANSNQFGSNLGSMYGSGFQHLQHPSMFPPLGGQLGHGNFLRPDMLMNGNPGFGRPTNRYLSSGMSGFQSPGTIGVRKRPKGNTVGRCQSPMSATASSAPSPGNLEGTDIVTQTQKPPAKAMTTTNKQQTSPTNKPTNSSTAADDTAVAHNLRSNHSSNAPVKREVYSTKHMERGIEYDEAIHDRPDTRKPWTLALYKKYGAHASSKFVFKKIMYDFAVKGDSTPRKQNPKKGIWFDDRIHEVPTMQHLGVTSHVEYRAQILKLFEYREDALDRFYNDNNAEKTMYEADEDTRMEAYKKEVNYLSAHESQLVDFASMPDNQYKKAVGITVAGYTDGVYGQIGEVSNQVRLMRNLGLDPNDPNSKQRLRDEQFWEALPLKTFKNAIGIATGDINEVQARRRMDPLDEHFMTLIGKPNVHITDLYTYKRKNLRGNQGALGHLLNNCEPLSCRYSLYESGVRQLVQENERLFREYDPAANNKKYFLLHNGEDASKNGPILMSGGKYENKSYSPTSEMVSKKRLKSGDGTAVAMPKPNS